jgi:hypothetical protein
MNDAPIGRTYRTGLWYRALSVLTPLVGCWILALYSRGVLIERDNAHVIEIAIGVGMLVFGAAFAVNAFVRRVSFSDTGIECSSIFEQVYFPYETIRGRREYVKELSRGRPRYLRLEANDGSKPLDIEKGAYDFDDAFWSWFNALPDLDAKEKASNFGLI